MPPAEPPCPTTLLEVACDESGSEGEKLVLGSTDTFAHASVDVATEAAAATIQRVRVEARSPATEVKASVVLRPQNRRLLEWLLGGDGPLLGRAHVHVTDKALHLTARMIELLGAGAVPDLAHRAEVLHRGARRRLGVSGWEGVLAEFNDIVRARSLDDALVSARALSAGLGELGDPDELGDGLAAQVPLEPDGLARLVGRGRTVLDPIVPALADAVHHWGRSGRPLWIIHDVQATLTDDAIRTAAGSAPDGASRMLQGVRFVDSQDDPRVQLADFLAGTARRIAAHVLAGRADTGLVELIAPYVSARSTWLDEWPAGPVP